MPQAPSGIGPRGSRQRHKKRRKNERAARPMQQVRHKPQRTNQPKPARQVRRESRY